MILPIEGTGTFGIRSQNSLVRYSDIYIETLGDVILDGRDRYYPETFENLSVEATKQVASPRRTRRLLDRHRSGRKALMMSLGTSTTNS
ncbi:MAG: hypothetical protein MZU97_10630 [Bacillus subtilis]|nr:hypothetical protein [Bacillus subtilis]